MSHHYSIKELYAIGEKVILQECLSRMHTADGSYNNNNNNTDHNLGSHFQQELLHFQLQLQKQLGHPITVNSKSEEMSQQDHRQQQLTSSVAEFFKKAQQNSLCEPSFDVSKVKLLSEVEAEMLGDRRD